MCSLTLKTFWGIVVKEEWKDRGHLGGSLPRTLSILLGRNLWLCLRMTSMDRWTLTTFQVDDMVVVHPDG